MSNTAKSILARLAAHTLILLLLFVLQGMVFSRLRIVGIAPLILPVSVVGVALFEGPTWGGGFGIAAGLLSDLSSTDTLVFFTVLMLIFGIFIGLMGEYVLARGFPSFLICSVLALLITAFLQMFGFLVFAGVPAVALIQVALGQSLYSAVFILPIYYLSRILSRRVLRSVL